MKKAKQGDKFWIGRFAVEMAVALSSLELGDPDLARAGLKETMEDFLATDADPDLIEYLDEIRRERHALTPVSISYRGEGNLTGQEIASVI